MKRTVFISHSSKDRTVAEEICGFLEGNGVACWMAPRDVMPGKNYGTVIVDAIDECGVFVLILSEESNKSGQVMREVERAASNESVIIPLRIDPVQPSRDLEFYVSSSHWLDATNGPLKNHLQTLLDAITDWQSSGKASRERVVTRTPDDHPPPRVSFRKTFMVAGGAAFALLCAIFAYLAMRHPTAKPEATQPAALTSAVQPAPSISPEARTVTGAPAPLAIEQVTASSQIPPEILPNQQKKNHGPEEAFDGDETTTWVPETGGIGQWLTVKFKTPVTINGVSIFGGSGVNPIRYQAHNRVRALRVISSDGTSETLNLEDKNAVQRFQLQRPIATDSVTFEIVAVYPGNKVNRTAISEISLN